MKNTAEIGLAAKENRTQDSRTTLVKELNATSPQKYKVNSFLNGLGHDGSYDWTNKKFDFMLSDPTYKVAYIEKDGEVIAAQDYTFSNGTLNLLRVRTSPEESKVHAQEKGLTLGDEIFDSVLRDNPSTARIYSEVNPNGMRYLKRQAQRRSLMVTRELAHDATGFGVIEINLNSDRQAAQARIQKLQQLKAIVSKAA